MPNILNDLGLQIKTRQEILTEFQLDLEEIYGEDIVLDSDSPDGQLINIFAQSIVDTLELLLQIYTSFDPDQAFGVVLDQRIAINGIQRQEGTYTTTFVDITTSRGGFELKGLDAYPEDEVYTVADNAGNEWLLLETFNVPNANTFSLLFRAAVTGSRTTIPGTITVPVTIVIHVSQITNPSTYYTLGIDEESDFNVKIRRQKSVSLASQGYLKGLQAALENVPGVISVSIYENRKGAPDMQSITTTYPQGTPSHCIWVIVDGTADDEEIAQAIYTKRNAGANMRGDDSFVITQVDGSPFEVKWDYASTEPVYIRFNVTSLDGVIPPAYDSILQMLPSKLAPRVYEQLNINDLATAIQEIDNNCLVTDAGFASSPTGPFLPVIQPSSRDKKFLIESDNIIILPLIISPSATQVGVDGTRQLRALGGFKPILWNVSGGGTISENGLFTAPSVPTTSTVTAFDDQGRTATSIITVV